MTLVLGRVSGRRATDWGTWTWFLHVEGRGCSATPDRCRLREHLMSGHALDNLLPLDVAVFQVGSGSEEASVRNRGMDGRRCSSSQNGSRPERGASWRVSITGPRWRPLSWGNAVHVGIFQARRSPARWPR